jgi:hypothetical protein
MGQFIDLSGSVIRNFTILERASDSGNGRTRWKVRCVCGKELIMHGSYSAFKRKRSCGCKRGHLHGNSAWIGKVASPEYQSWRAMRNRCLNPKDKSFKDYGGRGISICERWNDFTLFLEDMGSRPHSMTLDRINHDGNYEPTNCRWASGSTQAKNRRPRRSIQNFSDEEIVREYNRRFNGVSNGREKETPV